MAHDRVNIKLASRHNDVQIHLASSYSGLPILRES